MPTAIFILSAIIFFLILLLISFYQHIKDLEKECDIESKKEIPLILKNNTLIDTVERYEIERVIFETYFMRGITQKKYSKYIKYRRKKLIESQQETNNNENK